MDTEASKTWQQKVFFVKNGVLRALMITSIPQVPIQMMGLNLTIVETQVNIQQFGATPQTQIRRIDGENVPQ